MYIIRKSWEIKLEVIEMKKVLGMVLALSIMFPIQMHAQSDVQCPDAKNVVKSSLKKKDALLEALEEIVPNTYGEADYGNYFSKWEVTAALPFPQMKEKNEDKKIYEKAKKLCGEDVVNQSWLVRLHFPLWEGKSDAANGEIFLVENKKTGWTVWYRDK